LIDDGLAWRSITGDHNAAIRSFEPVPECTSHFAMPHQECRDLHVGVLIDDAGRDLVWADSVPIDFIRPPEGFLVPPTNADVFRVCLEDMASSELP
jgi:hypothetical protein